MDVEDPQDAQFDASPTDASFVPSLAKVLTHLISMSQSTRGQITRFHAIKAPNISIHDYLMRIAKYFGCSHECFVLSLVYIDRIVKIHQDFTISSLNIHRLLVTAIMLAVKYFDDKYYANAYYAKVGGVKTREINVLEVHFLTLIGYQLFVTPQEYEQYRNNVLLAVNAAGTVPSEMPAGAEGGEANTPAVTAADPSASASASSAVGGDGGATSSTAAGGQRGSVTAMAVDSGEGGGGSSQGGGATGAGPPTSSVQQMGGGTQGGFGGNLSSAPTSSNSKGAGLRAGHERGASASLRGAAASEGCSYGGGGGVGVSVFGGTEPA